MPRLIHSLLRCFVCFSVSVALCDAAEETRPSIKANTANKASSASVADPSVTPSSPASHPLPAKVRHTETYATALEPAQIGPTALGLAEPDLELQEPGQRMADALANFTEGLIQEENAETDLSLEAYIRVLERDPGQVDLAVKVAYEFTRRGDYTRAIGLLKDAQKANPKAQAPYLNLATLYARNLKKPEIALQYAEDALTADPNSAAGYQSLYEIYSAIGQPGKAAKTLERATQIKNRDPDFWMQIGDLHSRLLLRDNAPTPEADVKKIGQLYTKALEYAADRPDVLNRVADFYVASSQIHLAIPLYLKIMESREEEAVPILSNVREKLARSFLVSGQRKEAIETLEKIIAADPTKIESYDFLGQLHEENGNLERALAAFQQSLLLDPAEALRTLRVANIQMKLDRFDDAVTLLSDARSQFPELPQITYSLALAYGQGKKFPEALRTFEEAEREAKDKGDEIANGSFYFSYGAAAEQAGQPEKAATLFRRSIAIDPSNAAPACNYLGYMWVDRNINLEEAEQLIRKALELDDSNPAYVDSLGWLYFRQGDYPKALVELLRAAEQIKPEDATVFDHLGDTYEKLNNMPQALLYWTKALLLEPKNSKISAKIDRAKKQITSVQSPPPR